MCLSIVVYSFNQHLDLQPYVSPNSTWEDHARILTHINYEVLSIP